MNDPIESNSRSSTEETSLQILPMEPRSQADYVLVDYGNLINQVERIKEICDQHRDSYDSAKDLINEIDEVLL